MSLTSCSRHPVKLFLFFLPFLPPLVFEKAEIMPPFVLALQCHEQASIPFLWRMLPCITMELDACKDLARDITLSPNLRERLRQSGWVQP